MNIKPNEAPVDCMVRSINNGHNDREIYDFILDTCSLSFNNRSERQEMADQISQIRRRDLWATSDLEIK